MLTKNIKEIASGSPTPEYTYPGPECMIDRKTIYNSVGIVTQRGSLCGLSKLNSQQAFLTAFSGFSTMLRIK